MDFITDNRNVTSEWHIFQVRNWLKFDAGRHLGSVLFYAGFELRCAIERMLFEVLYFLKDCKISDEEQKRCERWKGINKLINEAAPKDEYPKRVEFSNIIRSVNQIPIKEVVAIDLKKIRNSWYKISNLLCHKQLESSNTFGSKSWIENGFNLIHEVLEELEWYNRGSFGVMVISSMPKEVQDLYKEFLNNKVTVKQVETRLELMEPVLRSRKIHGK